MSQTSTGLHTCPTALYRGPPQLQISKLQVQMTCGMGGGFREEGCNIKRKFSWW